MMNFRHKFCFLTLAIGLLTQPSYAAFINAEESDLWGSQESEPAVDDQQTQVIDYLQVRPSGTIWGLAGKEQVAKLQGLWPFGGDGLESIYYGAIEGAGSYKTSNGYSTGLGVGTRHVFNNSWFLGGYIFADFNRSPCKHNAWVANPGIELANYSLDFHMNGYFPTRTRNWIDAPVVGESIGITDYEKFTGNTKTDHLFQNYEETGPGFDAEIGALIPIPKTHGLRAYVGGYHYSMQKTDSVNGIAGRLLYPINKNFALEVRDTYDKTRKNVLMGGIRVALGGYSQDERDGYGIAGRLSDPIEHNLANLNSGNTVLFNKKQFDIGIYTYPETYFFWRNEATNDYANPSHGDGTYEHPFTNLDQNSYDSMRSRVAPGQRVMMYFAGPGAFGNSGLNISGAQAPGRMPLYYGYSMYGRTWDFKSGASNRPLFYDGIDLYGDSTIDAFAMQVTNKNFGSLGALYIASSSVVNINNVKINITDTADAYGISAKNSKYVNLNNVDINVTGKNSIAVNAIGSHITINSGGNQFSATATNGNATGFLLDGSRLDMLLVGNQATVHATGGNAVVFDIKPNSVLNIAGPASTTSASSNWLNHLGFDELQIGNANTMNNIFNADVTGPLSLTTQYEAYGIRVLDGQHKVTIENVLNSIFNIGQNSPEVLHKAYGIYANNADIGTVGNSNFYIDTSDFREVVAGNISIMDGIYILANDSTKNTVDTIANSNFYIGQQYHFLDSGTPTNVGALAAAVYSSNTAINTITGDLFKVDNLAGSSVTGGVSNSLGFGEYGSSTVHTVANTIFDVGTGNAAHPGGHGSAIYGFFAMTIGTGEVVNFANDKFYLNSSSHASTSGIDYYSGGAGQPINAQVNLQNTAFGRADGSDRPTTGIVAGVGGTGFVNHFVVNLQDNNNINSTANGVYLSAANSSLVISGNSNRIVAYSDDPVSSAYGIHLNSGNSLVISGSNNLISGNTNGTGTAFGGLLANSTSIITGNSNRFIGNSSLGNAWGVYLNNNNIFTINGNNNSFLAITNALTGTQAKGFEASYDRNNIIVNGNNNLFEGLVANVNSASSAIALALDAATTGATGSVFTISNSSSGNSFIANSYSPAAALQAVYLSYGAQLNINGNGNTFTVEKLAADGVTYLNNTALMQVLSMNSNNETVTINGNTNVFQVHAANVVSSTPNFMTVATLSGANDKLIVNGAGNKFLMNVDSTNTPGSSITGILAAGANSEVDLNGNNNLVGVETKSELTPISGARSDIFGINVQGANSNLNINGSSNSIKVVAIGGHNVEGDAVNLQNSDNFVIRGNNNLFETVIANAGNATTDVGTAVATALRAGSNLNVLGSNNYFHAVSNSNWGAIGIYMGGAGTNTATISGASNTITATGSVIAYGIYMSNNVLKINGTGTTINSNAPTAYGIYATTLINSSNPPAGSDNLVVRNTQFNVNGSTANYGIYSTVGYSLGSDVNLRSNSGNSFSANLDTDAKKVGHAP